MGDSIAALWHPTYMCQHEITTLLDTMWHGEANLSLTAGHPAVIANGQLTALEPQRLGIHLRRQPGPRVT